MPPTAVPAKPVLSQLFPPKHWPLAMNSLTWTHVQNPFFCLISCHHSACLIESALRTVTGVEMTTRTIEISWQVQWCFKSPDCSLTACMGWRSQPALSIKLRNNSAPSKADQLALQPWDWWMQFKVRFEGRAAKGIVSPLVPWNYLLLVGSNWSALSCRQCARMQETTQYTPPAKAITAEQLV